MIPVEIKESTLCREHSNEEFNEGYLNTNPDLLGKVRERVRIQEMTTKQRASKKYNSKLHPGHFIKGI